MHIDLAKEPVAPHMTIAEFITLERSEEILTALGASVGGGIFRCDEIVYATPDDSFRFHAVLSMPLGAGH